jgi:hypothetical protein
MTNNVTQLAPFPVFRAWDNNGNPLASGQLYTYAAGTSTPLATYTDNTAGTPNTNPVILNARGEANVWLTPGQYYKFVLQDSLGNTIWTVDQISAPLLTVASLGALLYPQTTIEIAAGITPTNLQYAPGDLRRYGAKIDGSTDDTAAINGAIKVAIAGLGFIYHPGGTCVHASQILFATSGTGLNILGNHYNASIFNYSGSAATSAWRITNNTTTPGSPTPNSSGYGLVSFEKVKITTSVGSSTAAGIEINACGFSFYNIISTHVSGTFKYGIILDGTEVVNIEKCILENSGPSNAANLWIVNGADRTAGQAVGFTNSIFVHGNQFNISGSGSNSIADDGGSDHYFRDNNLNGAAVPIRICGASAFEITGNEMENGLGGSGTGEANIDFLILTLGSGAVGPCSAGVVSGNYFGADMAGSSSSLRFGGGGAKHYGIKVHGNYFRENSGASADIYVTNLGSSEVGPNYHAAQNSSVTPYTGTHNDSDGNHLWPPQNGYLGTWASNHVWGDSRYLNQFVGGVSADSPNGLCIDEQQHQNFTIVISNASGTLQVAIEESGTSGATAAYANKLTGNTTTPAALPTVSSTVGFGGVAAGMYSGSLSVLVLNVTNAQIAGKGNMFAFIEQYTGNVAAYTVYCGLASRNVNGTSEQRPEIRLVNALTGAAVNFATALPANGQVLNIKFVGYLA